MTDSTGIKKIAILGGGPAALAAAFELTDQPGWQEKYEITVYQLGWRLGGKCATGRGDNMTVEEHGWHAWFGCYENAFGLMRKCYTELERAPGENFTTWTDAFKPQTFGVGEEFYNGQWYHNPATALSNDDLPGEGHELPSLWDYVEMLFEALIAKFTAHEKAGTLITKPDPNAVKPHWWSDLLPAIERDAEFLGLSAAGQSLNAANQIVHVIKAHHQPIGSSLMAPPPLTALQKVEQNALVWLLDEYLKILYKDIGPRIGNNYELYEIWCLSDFVCSNIKGIVVDEVATKGFNSIDGPDYVQWLQSHGLKISPDYHHIRAIYDAVFAYDGGTKPNISAGVALHVALRLTFTYKSAPLYEMQAGMGETVITPFYLVLKRRGVQFKFFHRVKHLGLSPDKKFIDTIQIGRQVTLKGKTYKPLYDVKGLGCWLSEPFYDQIVEGEELKAKNVNLESYWSDWKDIEDITLKVGQDFDLAILGISIGALPFICQELIDTSDAWKNMIANVKTVQTEAAQLWLMPSVGEMGWPMQRPIFATYAEPLNVWADVSYVIPWEDWPINDRPGCLFYLLGPAPTPDGPAPIDKPDYPKEQDKAFHDSLIDYLDKNTSHILPYATTKDRPNGLNWDLLAAPDNLEGQDRLSSQYLRVNYEPTERYVLSLAGSGKYRLKTDQSGFSNLFLVGDWINTGINVGCVEVAVMSGMQASRAICGYPLIVIGENRF